MTGTCGSYNLGGSATLLLQLALTCLVVGLHAVVALTLHTDGLLEYLLLLLFL